MAVARDVVIAGGGHTGLVAAAQYGSSHSKPDRYILCFAGKCPGPAVSGCWPATASSHRQLDKC